MENHLRLVSTSNPWHDPRSYETPDAGVEGPGYSSPGSVPRSRRYIAPHRLAQIVPGAHDDRPDLIEQLRQDAIARARAADDLNEAVAWGLGVVAAIVMVIGVGAWVLL